MSTNEPMKRCPYCGEQVLAVAVRCKHCQADLSSARQDDGPGAGQVREAQAASTRKPLSATARVFAVLFIIGTLTIVGFLVGEYYPVVGNPLASIAQPFSPVRNQTGLLHAAIGAGLGIVLSLLARDKR